MNREELYNKLLNAYSDYRKNNLLQSSYITRVLRIVKEYLQYEEIIKENTKLKKVIEILKDNIYFKFNDECTYICLKRDEYDECDYTIIHPNKEQYNLLKEVLDND